MLFEGVGSVVDFAQLVSQMIQLFLQLSCKIHVISSARSSVDSLASAKQHGQIYQSIYQLLQFPARTLAVLHLP